MPNFPPSEYFKFRKRKVSRGTKFEQYGWWESNSSPNSINFAITAVDVSSRGFSKCVEFFSRSTLNHSSNLKIINMDHTSDNSKNDRHDFIGLAGRNSIFRLLFNLLCVVVNFCFANGYEKRKKLSGLPRHSFELVNIICIFLNCFRYSFFKWMSRTFGITSACATATKSRKPHFSIKIYGY